MNLLISNAVSLLDSIRQRLGNWYVVSERRRVGRCGWMICICLPETRLGKIYYSNYTQHSVLVNVFKMSNNGSSLPGNIIIEKLCQCHPSSDITSLIAEYIRAWECSSVTCHQSTALVLLISISSSTHASLMLTPSSGLSDCLSGWLWSGGCMALVF